jgi:hypothetical protein
MPKKPRNRYIITKEDQRPKPRAKLPPNKVEKDKSIYSRKKKYKNGNDPNGGSAPV